MLRALTVATAIAAICGAIAAFGSSAAVAAAPPNAQLTSTEYTRLATAIDALKQSLSSKKLDWKAAVGDCQALGSSTPLLDTQRRSCADEVELDLALVKFEADQGKCASKLAIKKAKDAATTSLPTTTATTPVATTTTPATTVPTTMIPTTPTPTTTTPTPTTTTPTPTTPTTPTTKTTPSKGGFTATDLKLVSCLDSDYQALGHLTQLNYSIDVLSRKDAVARGFTGKCLATLVPTSAQIRDDESFAFSAKHLAADVALITRVAHGKASPSKLNRTWIADDARDFSNAAATVESQSSPQKLSVCPHAQAAT